MFRLKVFLITMTQGLIALGYDLIAWFQAEDNKNNNKLRTEKIITQEQGFNSAWAVTDLRKENRENCGLSREWNLLLYKHRANLYVLKINSKICDFLMQSLIIFKPQKKIFTFNPAHHKSCQISGPMSHLSSMTVEVRILAACILCDI